MFNIHDKFFAKEVEAQQAIFIRNACSILGDNGIVKAEHRSAIAQALLCLYSSRDRFYHTYVHVNEILDDADRYFTHLTPSERLGILFHDVIYVPGQVDNEGRSIDLMVMLMAGYGVPITEYCWASRCIKETANHLQVVHDPSTHAVLDLDLASLGGSYFDFERNNELIRLEYPRVLDSERADFLAKFLQKERIYYRLTELEEPARANIEKYIKSLR